MCWTYDIFHSFLYLWHVLILLPYSSSVELNIEGLAVQWPMLFAILCGPFSSHIGQPCHFEQNAVSCWHRCPQSCLFSCSAAPFAYVRHVTFLSFLLSTVSFLSPFLPHSLVKGVLSDALFHSFIPYVSLYPLLLFIPITFPSVFFACRTTRADRKVRFPKCWGYRERF